MLGKSYTVGELRREGGEISNHKESSLTFLGGPEGVLL